MTEIRTADTVVTLAEAGDAPVTVATSSDARRTLAAIAPIEVVRGAWIISEFEDAYTGDTIADFEAEFASVGAFEIASER